MMHKSENHLLKTQLEELMKTQYEYENLKKWRNDVHNRSEKIEQ